MTEPLTVLDTHHCLSNTHPHCGSNLVVLRRGERRNRRRVQRRARHCPKIAPIRAPPAAPLPAPEGIKKEVVAARAINWGNDPFARGAYSYATPKTRRQLASIVIRGAGTARESGTQEHTLIKA